MVYKEGMVVRRSWNNEMFSKQPPLIFFKPVFELFERTVYVLPFLPFLSPEYLHTYFDQISDENQNISEILSKNDETTLSVVFTISSCLFVKSFLEMLGELFLSWIY